jgi:hypothetical protein
MQLKCVNGVLCWMPVTPQQQQYQFQSQIDWRQFLQDLGLVLGIAVSIGTLIQWADS